MHPTQHTTIQRRSRAFVSQPHGIECTHEDILEHIQIIASRQQTCFVMIATLSVSLGLNADDRTWLLDSLHLLDNQGRVMLSALERPQDLNLYQASWFVRNASGIPCHEVCVAPDSHRLKPLLQQNAPELPVYRSAQDSSTHNPMMQKHRVSALVAGAAATLFRTGNRAHTQFRVLIPTSTGEAA
jgi:hypothetical protein